MKLELHNMSLVDALVVCKGLPADEIRQIEAFSGEKFDAQNMAVQLVNSNGPQFTLKDVKTGEPLVVGGYIQVGATIWRSFMLANQRAWDEHGAEVTQHASDTIDGLLQGQQHIRLETLCLADREQARAWYPRIGLKYESTLEGYGVNGETAVMYVRTQGAEES